jgi:anti-anti-sigma regulatory factor
MSAKRQTRTVKLPPDCTLKFTKTLHKKLLKINTAPGERIIDAGAVSHIDVSGLQLLAVFVADLRQRQIQVSWRNCPEVLSHNARAVGLSTLLQLS